MKILLFAIFLLAPIAAYSQCTSTPTDPCVPVNQSILDRASKGLKELASARDALQKFTNERAANDALNAASLQVIKAANEVIAYKDKIIADQDKLNAMYEKVIQLQSVLIEKLTAQIGQKPSAWSKFIQTVEKIALITLGITVGRGL